MAISEGLVRGFSPLWAEVPLWTETLSDCRNFQQTAHFTIADAAAHPKISALIWSGSLKSKGSENTFLREFVFCPG